MAGRSRDTYKKRQKEVARAEKQREKVARRLERKLHKNAPEMGAAAGVSDETTDEEFTAEPIDTSLDRMEPL
jgi:hypothetical protein